jgi:neural Wiskott-Aldrich syndrome protein
MAVLSYSRSRVANEGSQEWSGATPASPAPAQAAIHAVAQLSGPPEGGMLQTIPLIYPGYMPPLQPDGQPAPDGTVPNGHPPVMPYYITGFPPTFPYPYGLMPLPQSSAQQPQPSEGGPPKADEAGTSAAAVSATEAGPVN